jgi:hypothetical protein
MLRSKIIRRGILLWFEDMFMAHDPREKCIKRKLYIYLISFEWSKEFQKYMSGKNFVEKV